MNRFQRTLAAPSPSPFDTVPLLSPFIVGKLARRKGLIIDTVMMGEGGRRIVRLADVKTGSPVENPSRAVGFTLPEAKRLSRRSTGYRRARRMSCIAEGVLSGLTR
jgi:hypothetical protein